ncbi:MAG: VWA domain-containing protein [Proteobacteria bacterium]|nr:VWA domain-containing protein [Pseudomonadota bacterium]
MAFDSICFLWLLLLIPLFIIFSIQAYRKSNRWLNTFARKNKSVIPYLVSTLFLCFTILSVTLSIAQPKAQYKKTYFNRAGIELAIGIDVSKSMLAEDVSFPPEGMELFTIFNRLNRARYFAINLLSKLHGERIGACIFADKGIEIIPFTRDYGFCRYILKHLNDTEITTPGSDLGEAIGSGITMLESSRSQGAKIIILISDGEDISLDKSSLYEFAQLAADKRIKIYTIGIGNGKGVLIPLRSEDGTAILNYYVDEDGEYLKTNLVQDTLKNIADITDGEYFRLTEEDTPEKLIEAILQKAKTIEETKSIELAWLNLSPFFLLGGLAFFVAAMTLN